MQVTFPRLADGARAYSIIERADGVSYRVYEGVAGSTLPHDLVHLVVERETGDDGGFWGAVAAGAVFDSMEHLAGRRPPHVKQRSAQAVRDRGQRLLRAELMAGLVEHIAHTDTPSPDYVRAAAREALSTLPDSSVDAQQVIRAAGCLRDFEYRWARLSPGETIVVQWRQPRTRRRE